MQYTTAVSYTHLSQRGQGRKRQLLQRLRHRMGRGSRDPRTGAPAGGRLYPRLHLSLIHILIEAAELSQGQIAQLLERLQRHTALSGAKTEQMQEFTDRYNALLAQLAGRLEVIDKENRTIITEVLSFKKSLSEFKNEVDTTKFEKLANNTLWEMKTQIRYLKQPPIVLRTIVFLTVLSILTILATGYL